MFPPITEVNKLKIPEDLKKIYTTAEWKSFDLAERTFLASASFQDPDNYVANSKNANLTVDYFPFDISKLEKPSDINWRNLQKQVYKSYKTFGPLNSAVDNKADLVAGKGFDIYSDVYEINEFVRDLVFSYRNRLYLRATGWMVRMQTEGELFLLISLDDTGTATVRVLEPERIGDGTDEDKGIFTDPDDLTQSLFYSYRNAKETELIPDVRFILEPDLMKEKTKALKEKFDKSKISDLTKGKGKFSRFGGYRRFVFHWKNLTGICEHLRDVSSLSTTIEWINLYIQSLKWELDYRKALCSYTIEIGFDNEKPSGKMAWHIWNKMTDTQKDATNLTKPLTPGSRVFVMPGMFIKLHAPQLTAMHGDNQPLLDLAGAGAKTPQDMFQGQSANATYASLKTSRPPLVAAIENLQSKFEKFWKYELLRICFKAKNEMGGGFLALDGESKLKIEKTYKKKWAQEVNKGKAKIIEVSVEPIEKIKFSWPVIKLDMTKDMSNALLGSKHTGLVGLGLSEEEALKRMGIHDYSRQKRRTLIEHEEYGKPISAEDQEQAVEEETTDNEDEK